MTDYNEQSISSGAVVRGHLKFSCPLFQRLLLLSLREQIISSSDLALNKEESESEIFSRSFRINALIHLCRGLGDMHLAMRSQN